MIFIIASFTNVVMVEHVCRSPVAMASVLFILIAVLIGYLLYWKKQSLAAMTVLGLVLLVLAIWFSLGNPLTAEASVCAGVLLVYIILAAALPVTILLQPRDYLNAYLLVAFLVIGGLAFIITGSSQRARRFDELDAVLIGGKASLFWPTCTAGHRLRSLPASHAIVGSGIDLQDA